LNVNHAGALQADDDYNNHCALDIHQHPCNSRPECCTGYTKGYKDKVDFYA